MLRSRGGQRRHQVDPLDPKTDVKSFAARWLEGLDEVQSKTFASYQETVNRYIVKPGVGIGALRVRDVVREDVEEMLKQAGLKSRAGVLSKNTLRIIRAVVTLVFDAATRARVLDGSPLIEANPCRGIKIGKLSKADRQRTIRAMTVDQQVRFLRAAKRHCTRRDYTLFHTLADTGARPSEALALQWSDVDLDGRKLRIERGYP